MRAPMRHPILHLTWAGTIASTLSSATGCNPTQAQEQPPGSLPNIVVVSIDGMRLDRAHFAGGPHPCTPNLDAFVAEGVWFENSFSQSNESLLSHAALFTGRYPLEVSVPNYLRYVMGPEQLTFPEVLQQVGYDTGAFLAQGHVGHEYGFNQGFDLFYEGERWGSFQETVPVALSWLEQRKEQGQENPFMVFLHGYDLHRPYWESGPFHHPFQADYQGSVDELLEAFNLTEKIINGVYYPDVQLERIWHSTGSRILDPRQYTPELVKGQTRAEHLSPEALDHIKAHYDSGVLVADTFVGFFFEGIDHLGLWEDTVIIVLSDHGEDLQDHGFTNHRAVVQDTTTRVPMLVGGGAIPDAWRGTIRTELVDAVDLVPTITDIARTVPPAGVQGRSIWTLLQTDGTQDAKDISFHTGVLGQVSARTRSHRFVFQGTALNDPFYADKLRDTPIDSPDFALYRPADDPLELKDIKEWEPQVAEKLRARMLEWYTGQDRGETSQRLTEAQKQALRDGGYW